jgi:hypothetical protein
MPYSDAVARGIICIENYLDDEIPIEFQREGKDSGVRGFLDDIRVSIKQLGFTERLLAGGTGRDYANLRSALAAIAGDERVFEYFAGLHALETLYRVESSKERILEVIGILPATRPPTRSRRYLERVVECVLGGFDEEAIVMARAVVEVLVEEKWQRSERQELGAMIRTCKKEGVISKGQAEDMWEINRQAREVIHDEVHRRPIDVLDCLRRVARLLEQLHPV